MNRPRNRTVRLGVGAVLVVAVVAALVVALLPNKATAPSKPTATTPTAKTQLAWLVAASHDLPVAPAELKQHFVPGYFHDSGFQAYEGILVNRGPLTLKAIRPTVAPRSVSAVTASVDASGTTSKFTTEIVVSRSGLIKQAYFEPLFPTPTSWSGVDRQLRALAPRVSFASNRVRRDGTCALVHGLNPGTPRPLGSAFKLYVLGALARSVAHHHARWGQKFAIRNAWKSLPSVGLRLRPAGTKLTLRTFADQMISASDNTAADHLIHRLGRAAVERQLHLFGNAHALLTTPFPTTRQAFTLKGHRYPRLADAYLAASPVERARLLDQTARVPLSEIHFNPNVPRDLGSIEWFGSPTDICHAFSGLLQQNSNTRLKAVGAALSINDALLMLNPDHYPMTWFKGGSEPGVDTVNYLVKAADGTVLVTSVMVSDPHHVFDDSVFPRAQAIIRGALALDHAR